MKVTCQSCQAKYTIADEKVRGKVAKIRCKKCGTTIIVNGTDVAAGGVVTMGAPPSPADDQWSVLVADGDQREVTFAQIVDLVASGVINSETPAWKDGMADWLPIGQIEALHAVVQHGPAVSMLPDTSSQVGSMLPDVSQARAGAQAQAAAPPAFPVAEPLAAKAPAARLAVADTARRRARGGSTDLFGASVQDDVMTSAAVDPVPHVPSGGGGADRMTGARNENSVLFSLASLTGGSGPAAQKPAPVGDKEPPSSKADLRSLMGSGESKPAAQKSKLDDIINLSGGGVYSPAMLAAPALAPPPVELTAAADAIGVPAKPKSKALLTLVVLGVVAIAGVAIAFTMNSKDEAEKAMAAASASAKAASEALAAALAAAESKPSAAEAPAASADSPAQAPTVLAPGQTAPKPEAEKKTVVAKTEKAAPAPDKEKPAPVAGIPPAAALGVPPPAPAAPKEPAPAAGGSGDFDRAAALSALSAAATAAQSCKKPDGPTGSGRIAVTFANNGQATTANVEGPPFAGTPVGGCVAARFRGTHVPPYGGTPITVHKTFNIN
jgi:predicted Zn finger-like uncharacterized protein